MVMILPTFRQSISSSSSFFFDYQFYHTYDHIYIRYIFIIISAYCTGGTLVQTTHANLKFSSKKVKIRMRDLSQCKSSAVSRIHFSHKYDKIINQEKSLKKTLSPVEMLLKSE